MRLPQLAEQPDAPFPPVEQALRDPDGLLAWGGDLTPSRLINAYRHGIFPWYSENDPILWWAPDPRTVFETTRFQLSRRDRRMLAARQWRITADTGFSEVIAACASTPRAGQPGTWINPAMRAAYTELHDRGHAHSIEVRDHDGALVGGLYGVSVGRVFFGESMVSLASGGSKAALAALCLRLGQWGFPIIDAQVESPHLLRMGAKTLARRDFSALLARETAVDEGPASWRERFGHVDSTELR